jgi:ribosomal protein L11 methylase PrmA
VGSFRDPSGYVFTSGDRIFRAITPVGAAQFEASQKILGDLVTARRLVDFSEVDPRNFDVPLGSFSYLIEHPRLPVWSMPYEWSFSLLKDAALFHLDLHLYLLDRGFTLSDASAYNVQFIGPRPIFVDHLSIRPYQDGEFWLGHKQFCEQFLNPLLLRSFFDVSHNSWYRGNLEGIPQEQLADLLPFWRKFSWRVLSHVTLPARIQKSFEGRSGANVSVKDRRLPKASFVGMLTQLRNWIGGLAPLKGGKTTWANYDKENSYLADEAQAKREFIGNFIKAVSAKTIIDLGCNTGDYSEASLASGAESVVGFDFDQQALDRAHSRAKTAKMNFLPLYLNAMNPSPNQGWRQTERSGFAERFRSDAVLALAFEHHLAIAHNVPLEQAVAWVTGVAPVGVIEFVPKTDPTIQKMLSLRSDIFPDYTEERFAGALARDNEILEKKRVSESGRVLFAFRKRA